LILGQIESEAMDYNLQEAIDHVVDAQRTPELRAIDFFTFLVALHLGRSKTKVTGFSSPANRTPSLILKITDKTIRDAKMLCAMKFLDRIEQDWKIKHGQDVVPSIRDMIKIPAYEAIINQVILSNGSWYKLRYLDSVRDLEHKLAIRKRRARDVSRIVEFSFRFDANPLKRKQRGGVTMATDIVTSAPYFKVGVKESQLEEAWSHLRSAAPFLFLIYVQKYPFYLNKISGTRLAERLLAMVADQDRLLEFFAHYNYVIRALQERGYRYDAIISPSNIKCASLKRDPFRPSSPAERAVLDEIENYRK
jgi:hypothetical protein